MDQFDVQLHVPEGEAPLFVRVAEAVVDGIRVGRLAPGDRLPGTRRVADQLAERPQSSGNGSEA